MSKELDALHGHVIVCGYGRVGRASVLRLLDEGREFAVIDNDPRHEEELVDFGVPHIISAPEHESVLRRVGIARASALMCAVDSDAINVYITLAERSLCPGLTIVARAADPETIDVLKRAGADSVVSPYIVSGGQMAELAGEQHPASSAMLRSFIRRPSITSKTVVRVMAAITANPSANDTAAAGSTM